MKYSAFTLRANGITNQIKTDVKICDSYGTQKSVTVKAIWDTGASGTCISKKVANSLGLVPVGMSSHNTAAGTIDCYDYIVDIILPNQVCIQKVRVSDFLGGPDLDVLVGMDIICAGDFSITNANGISVVSFRIPPDAFHIDYVATQKPDKKGKLLKDQLKKKQI